MPLYAGRGGVSALTPPSRRVREQPLGKERLPCPSMRDGAE
ncbi:hypothetical protein HMPREF0262_03725 [Clostridium sp. ATCC 29733]|nr:hypothetical protein HMPREF0262_03725 [Clostridium sp. ATCC 29733]